MQDVLTLTERDRRWAALSAAMAQASLDAMVFVANDYNGHKGTLRYVANHRVFGFPCYAVMGRDAAPVVILPAGMRGIRRGGWVDDYRFARNMVDEVAATLLTFRQHARVGVVGLERIMRLEDYRRLVAALPGVEIVDATDLFEQVRAVKSGEEVRGAQEAASIADRCLDRLIEIVRPGITKRQLAAETYKTCAELGGLDPIWLTVDNLDADGPERTRFSPPSDDVVAPTELLMFSFELIGPSGYWVELCRMMTFSEPSSEALAIHAAVRSTMDAARVSLHAGADPRAAQRAMMAAANAAGTQPAYWLGHGIGQDVIETPLLGFDVVEDRGDDTPSTPLTSSMTFAVHPLLVPDSGLAGYMADTYVVEDDSARVLSRHSLDLLRLG